MAARILAAASAAGLAASAGIESCMTAGKGYNDPKLNMTPNGGVGPAITPEMCQMNCENTVFCAYWTFYNNSGGCWLQGTNATLTIQAEGVVSGSMDCVKAAKAANETAVAVPMAKEAGSSELAAAAVEGSGGGGMPTWAWALVGVAGAGAIGGGAYAALGGSDKKNKSKKSSRAAKLKKAEKATRDVEATDPSAAPLMAAEAPQAYMQYPAASYAQQPMQYAQQPMQYAQQPMQYAQQPMQYASPMPMAAPMNGVMLPPVYSAPAPMYVNQAGEPVAMPFEAAPMAEAPAA